MVEELTTAEKHTYVDSALFIYIDESEYLLENITNNSHHTQVTSVSCKNFSDDPEQYLNGVNHVVISSILDDIKFILNLARQYNFSVGLIPLESQKSLIKSLELSTNTEVAIEQALRENAPLMDLIVCNGTIVLSRASIGRVPLLDESDDISLIEYFSKAFNKLRGIKLLKFSFTTANKKNVITAASGCMVLQHSQGSLASKLISNDNSARDGSISLIISSPYSIIDYFKFLIQTWHRSPTQKKLPAGTGYLKSDKILIETASELSVFIDGNKETKTPVQCETIKDAIRINIGDWLEKESANASTAKERIRIDNIPDQQELVKTVNRKIPFFSYASEERFRDLFMSLRDDAKVNSTYIVLMLLSSALAAFGLFLNSSAVIIGAMLLAPLMSPIVSISMGLLRQDNNLLKESAKKVAIGVGLALSTSVLIALMFPHKPVTPEMLGRLNPTLLDLAVAIISGIAAAYSKSFKEVMQSLAGVAIAVALVPPLAVAGIGLGQADLWFFIQAFLLFFTNLVGIILSATITFRILGYSSVLRNKRGFMFVMLSFLAISIPLYISYHQIVTTLEHQTEMEKQRFLVNDKYIILRNVRITYARDKRIIDMDILTRDNLSRHDMDKLKQKIQSQFDKRIFIRTKVINIL